MVILLHNIRSVQNVASIFRTADGVGVKKIYLCGITPGPVDRLGRDRAQFIKISLGSEKSVPYEKKSSTLKTINELKKDFGNSYWTSSTSNDGNYLCDCVYGNVWNLSQTKCIPYDQACSEIYGPSSYYLNRIEDGKYICS